jgi:hypothetical protein
MESISNLHLSGGIISNREILLKPDIHQLKENTMPATYNNKARITRDDKYIVKHEVPNIRVDSKMVSNIVEAFKLSGDYLRKGEVSQTVKNPVGQYCQNSRVTGRVYIKVKGRKSPVTVDLFSYWPSWSHVLDSNGKPKLDAEGNPIRVYSKEHGSTLVTLMQSGGFRNPTMQGLEHLAYCALGIVKARVHAPREGLIKSEVLTRLESAGLEVVKCWYKGQEYNRQYITDKLTRMRRIFDAVQGSGEYLPIEKRRGNFVIGIEGQ